jgi:hypothetical protein
MLLRSDVIAGKSANSAKSETVKMGRVGTLRKIPPLISSNILLILLNVGDSIQQWNQRQMVQFNFVPGAVQERNPELVFHASSLQALYSLAQAT